MEHCDADPPPVSPRARRHPCNRDSLGHFLSYAASRLQIRILGLDIFFTLSGFLITCLLLEELLDERHSTGTIGFTRFYLRRDLRLLPEFLVMATWLVTRIESLARC